MLNISNTLLLYDQDYKQPTEIFYPFAENNALLKGIKNFPDNLLLHFWTMNSTVVLGMTDVRLPKFTESLPILKNAGYRYFVRNSGGLAVVCDKDILNVSIFIPREKNNININEAYELMVKIISDTFPNEKIEAKEIINSYCPGDYDLSINNKKFAGISQRRTSGGIVVMAYISVTGKQNYRSQSIKDFYTVGNNPPSEKFEFPEVDLNVMDNLDNLIGTKLTTETLKNMFINSLSKNNNFDSETIKSYMHSDEYIENLNTSLNDLRRRNKDIAN